MLVRKPAFNSMLVKSDHVRSGVLRRARDAKKNYPIIVVSAGLFATPADPACRPALAYPGVAAPIVDFRFHANPGNLFTLLPKL